MGKEMSKILPGLYLGRLDNAQNDNDMMANCITHVLSVHEPVKQKLQKFNSYKYFEVNVKDEESACLSKYFSKTNDFIHEGRMKNGNVLVHCLAGVSRAPTVVLAYLMTIYELNFQDAFNCLRAVRPNIKPIPNFVKQLNDFEFNEVFHERERILSTFGVYQNLEDDKKMITELIAQYENRENDYINNSIESNSDPFNFGFEEPLNPDYFDNINPISNISDNINSFNPEDFLPINKSHNNSSPQPDFEEEVDIPGSIPIGAGIDDKSSKLGTSSSDFRGRAHSRGAHAALPAHVDPIFNRYGQTAPPSLPLFFKNSD